MRPSGYSPYQNRRVETGTDWKSKIPSFSGGTKKWLLIILGTFLALFLLFYMCLGDLRFFANHLLRLGFFNNHYLILLQNNYESRPGGGFITAYGDLKVTMGIPHGLSFHNSYDIDTDNYVTPPYPHEEFLKNEWYQGWSFRDSNWEANFPEAADDIIKFYEDKFEGNEIDGIIVVNFSLIENLIDKLGGIKINGEEITKNNLFTFLTNEVNNVDRHDEKALANRKSVLSDLAGTLLPKLKWNFFDTKSVIEEGLKTKDIYFWFKSESLENKIERKGWGNSFVLPEGSDFLAVNIANLGAKKADRYLQKEIHYYANVTKEVPEITTEVTIRYPGFNNQYADDYKGYLQIIIPAGAQINSDALDSRVTTQEEFKIIGDQIVLPAGSKTTYTYTYTLPRTLLNSGEYKLRLIKQSGSEQLASVTVETAPGTLTQSDKMTTRENRAMWHGLIETDMDFEVQTTSDSHAPYPIEQVFDDLTHISIYWSEPMENASAASAMNYKITDADYIGEPTDEVKVVYAEMTSPNTVQLELEGMTEQKLERYEIEMKGIRDKEGNVIEPNPKNITVVQRLPELETVSEE